MSLDKLTFSIQVLLLKPQQEVILVVPFSLAVPLRAVATNTKQWNGQYGCLYCLDEGTTIGTDHLH